MSNPKPAPAISALHALSNPAPANPLGRASQQSISEHVAGGFSTRTKLAVAVTLLGLVIGGYAYIRLVPKTRSHRNRSRRLGKDSPNASDSVSEEASEISLEDDQAQLLIDVSAITDPDARSQLAETIKKRGNSHYKKKNHEMAVKFYSKAIELDVNNPTFYANRAAANMALERYDEVEKDCSKCVEIEPTCIKGWMRRSKANTELKNFRQALYDHMCAVFLECEDNETSEQKKLPDIIMALVEDEIPKLPLNESLPPPYVMRSFFEPFPKMEAEDNELQRTVLGLLDNGLFEDAEKAASWFNEEPLSSHDKAVLYNTRASFLYLRANQKASEEEFDKAFQTDPGNLNTILKQAMVLYESNRIPEAENIFDRVIEQNPGEPTSYFLRGQMREASNNFRGAYSDVEKAFKLDPSNGRFAIRMASFTLNMQQFPSETVRQNLPDNADGLSMKARILAAEGKADESMDMINRAMNMALKDHDHALPYVLGANMVLTRQRNTEEALKVVDRGIEKIGPHLELKFLQASLLTSAQDPSGASRERALEICEECIPRLRTKAEQIQLVSLCESLRAQSFASSQLPAEVVDRATRRFQSQFETGGL